MGSSPWTDGDRFIGAGVASVFPAFGSFYLEGAEIADADANFRISGAHQLPQGGKGLIHYFRCQVFFSPGSFRYQFDDIVLGDMLQNTIRY